MENITQTKKQSLQLRFNTFNLTSRVNFKHTLYYPICRKKITNSLGIKFQTLVLIFVVT